MTDTTSTPDPGRHGLLQATAEALVDGTRALVDVVASAGSGALGALPEPVPASLARMLHALRLLVDQMPPVTAQLDVLVQEVHAKRLSIQALQSELAVLDAQLAVLERSLAPVETWSRQWNRLRTSLDQTLPPAAE